MNDNVVENIRTLTGMERRYVNAYVVRRTWLQRIMGGVVLVCLSSFFVCAIVFIFDVDRMVELAWVFFSTQFLCFFGVRYFSKKYKVRGYAYRVGDGVSKVAGKFEELSFSVSIPNGGRHTHYRHFIGDIELIFPPGARLAFLGMHGRNVTLSGVLWHNLGDIEFSRYASKIMPEAAARVPAIQCLVLEWQGLIDVGGVLEKYGKYYFLQYRAKSFCEGLVLAVVVSALVGIPFLFDSCFDFYVDRSVLGAALLFLVHILASIAISIFILIYLSKGYVAIRKRHDPDYDTTPHEERLKGHW